MRRLVWIRGGICLAFVCIVIAYYQFSKFSLQKQRVCFREDSFDFGAVAEDGKYQHDFEFSNVSNHAVKVKRIRVSCGCISARCNVDTLLPGEAGNLRVEFNSAGLRPTLDVHRSVIVEFDGNAGAAMLGVFAKIVPPVTVSPERVELGENRETECIGLTVARTGLPLDRWSEVTLSSRNTSFAFRETNSSDERKTFMVTLQGGKAVGELDPIEVCIGHSHRRRILVPVRVVSQYSVRIIPPTYIMHVPNRLQAPLEKITREDFCIRSDELRNLQITRICPEGERFSDIIESEISGNGDGKFLLWMNSLGAQDTGSVQSSVVISYADDVRGVVGHIRLPVRIVLGI